MSLSQEIGLVPNGFDQGMTGPLGYYHIDNIQKSLQLIISAGGKALQDTQDVGGASWSPRYKMPRVMLSA